jgi:hypothetical protein
MAQRRTQAKGGSGPTDGEKEDDLNVLAPDREITVGGETVMVREYSFGEQLRHGALLAELTEALRPVKSTDADFVNRLLNILVEHQARMLDAIALSIGRDRAWIEALSGVEGEALALTWWQVNQGFFVRRLMVYPTLAASALSRAPVTAGGASSPPSSDTATPGAS